jgi:hypothetical protein
MTVCVSASRWRPCSSSAVRSSEGVLGSTAVYSRVFCGDRWGGIDRTVSANCAYWQ